MRALLISALFYINYLYCVEVSLKWRPFSNLFGWFANRLANRCRVSRKLHQVFPRLAITLIKYSIIILQIPRNLLQVNPTNRRSPLPVTLAVLGLPTNVLIHWTHQSKEQPVHQSPIALAPRREPYEYCKWTRKRVMLSSYYNSASKCFCLAKHAAHRIQW